MFEGLYRSSGGPASQLRDATESRFSSRQELLAREKNLLAAGIRPPRRAMTTNDYVYPTPPPPCFGRPETTPRAMLVQQNSNMSAPAADAAPTSVSASTSASTGTNTDTNTDTNTCPPTIDEEVTASAKERVMPTGGAEGELGRKIALQPQAAPQCQYQYSYRPQQQQQQQQAQPQPQPQPQPQLRPQPRPQPKSPTQPQRPQLGTPRRSYSVMDYEPVPPTQQPSDNLTLTDLPAELHFAIFDFLDPIDSTCLGLTSKHFYAIHRRIHGTVPLSARRTGPNDMEWVWHLAGRPASRDKESKPREAAAKDKHDTETVTKALGMLRVRGQALCRKCGVRRCELHTHIQDWMGSGYEYCTVRDKFGPVAPPRATEFCYLSNPKDPHRCGRHRVAKTRPAVPQRQARETH